MEEEDEEVVEVVMVVDVFRWFNCRQSVSFPVIVLSSWVHYTNVMNFNNH